MLVLFITFAISNSIRIGYPSDRCRNQFSVRRRGFPASSMIYKRTTNVFGKFKKPIDSDESIDGFTWDDVPEKGMPDLNLLNTAPGNFDFEEEFGYPMPENDEPAFLRLLEIQPLEGPRMISALKIESWEIWVPPAEITETLTRPEMWYVESGEGTISSNAQDPKRIRTNDLVNIPEGMEVTLKCSGNLKLRRSVDEYV
mmetsp:Transcript_21875/g.32599  ORF Transcript_21875/g.32599 Transcript_21875/m.32599 type:complete len:199 (-) Transcript_21875:77-673(-)